MKKGGLTAEGIEAKLREASGNMAAVARYFGVTRQAVWKFVQTRDKLRQATVDVRETLKDNAESSLYSAVLAGKPWAVCFFLKTQAKDRGYIENNDAEALRMIADLEKQIDELSRARGDQTS